MATKNYTVTGMSCGHCKAAVEQNKLKVVGGIYRLATGKVDLVN